MLLKVTDLDISYGSKATITGANIELKRVRFYLSLARAAAVKQR